MTAEHSPLIKIYRGTTFLRLFLFLCIGILLYNSLRVPLWILLAIGTTGYLMLIPAAIGRQQQLLAIAIPLFLIGLGACLSYREMPPKLNKEIRSFEITSDPRYKERWTAYDATLTTAEGRTAKIVVNMRDSARLTRFAEYRTRRPVNIHLPKYHGYGFNYRLYLLRHGYAGVVYLKSEEITQTDKPYSALTRNRSFDAFIGGLHLKCKNAFRRAGISPENVEVLNAIILGEKGEVSYDVQQDYRITGVSHVLVVSGMHIGILFLILTLVLGRILPRTSARILTIILLWGYALFTGLTPSVCRATFMYSTITMLRLFNTNSTLIQSLSLSAVVLTLINPLIIYDSGFQMSYTAVLSIALFHPLWPEYRDLKIAPRISKNRKALHTILTTIYGTATLTLSVQILMAPLVAYNFGQFPTYFLITNLAIVLALSPIFMLGLATLIPIVGLVTGPVLNLLVEIVNRIIALIATLPSAMVTFTVTPMQLATSYIIILLIYNVIAPRQQEGETIRAPFGSVVALLTGIIAVTIAIKADQLGLFV